MITRKPSLAVAAVGLAAMTLSGCGSDGADERQAAPSLTPVTSAPPTSAAPSASAPVPFPANTDPDEGGPDGGGKLSVTDVRVARQDGFDRVTYQLGGTGEPGWRVEYVDNPTQQGSGEPVQIAGDVYLSVVIRGVGYPVDTGQIEYAGPKLLSPADTRQIKGVRVFGVFEGYYDGVVGIAGAKRPFRVFALTNPTRVVLDVRDS